MTTRKIHCPICHGTGKISDAQHGRIACLNCVGTGIVDLDYEQQKIIDDINEEKRRAELEEKRKEEEKLRRQVDPSLNNEFV